MPNGRRDSREVWIREVQSELFGDRIHKISEGLTGIAGEIIV
jgi:hypothetical protein